MIVHEIIDCHAKHLFPVLREQIEAAIEDVIETGLLQNNESIRLDVVATVGKAVEETIRDGQADSAIRRVTSLTLESESFVEKITQRIVKDDHVVSSLATNAKLHIDKATDDWRNTMSLAETVAKLSDRKIQNKDPAHMLRRLDQCLESRSCSRDSHRREHRCSHSLDASDGHSDTDSYNSSQRSMRKWCQEELHSTRSKSRSHSLHSNGLSRRSSTE